MQYVALYRDIHEYVAPLESLIRRFDGAIRMDTRSNRRGDESRLAAAIAELRRERRRTTDELEAFRAFEDQVRMIPSENSEFERRCVVGSAATTVGSTGLERVREAYESTLMSVPHYLEEYDDSYVESLAEEFSPDLASALTDGTEFNEQCKRMLLSAVSSAQTARDSLIDVIDRERKSVLEAESDLASLSAECAELRSIRFERKQFGTLDAYRARLGVMTDKCERVSERRQDAIFDQRRIRWLPSDVTDVTTYLYSDLDFDYPVISVVAELLDLIEELLRRIERAIAFCDA